MGANKGVDSRVVRWIVVGMLIVVTGLRWWSWKGDVQRLTDGKWIRVIFTVTEVAWDDFGNGQVKFEGISIPLPSDVEIRLGQRVEVVGKVKVVEKGKRQFKRLEKVAWKVIDTRLGVMGTMLAMVPTVGKRWPISMSRVAFLSPPAC